jgi:hypothetical protein
MRCVWASQPDNDHHCPARIPRGVVAEAWWHERHASGVEEGFFRFLWNDREWLGYGVSDGRVRGVYCPVHTAERDTRAPRARELEGRTCVRALAGANRWEPAPLAAGPLPSSQQALAQGAAPQRALTRSVSAPMLAPGTPDQPLTPVLRTRVEGTARAALPAHAGCL